jgi:Retroviral aspartyl protease
VELRHPVTSALIPDVPILLDTGADVALLPCDYTERLGVMPFKDNVYEVEGFDGGTKLAEIVQLELVFLERKFKGQFLLIDLPMGILGRNILNAVALLLDGPRGSWKEQMD